MPPASRVHQGEPRTSRRKIVADPQPRLGSAPCRPRSAPPSVGLAYSFSEGGDHVHLAPLLSVAAQEDGEATARSLEPLGWDKPAVNRGQPLPYRGRAASPVERQFGKRQNE